MFHSQIKFCWILSKKLIIHTYYCNYLLNYMFIIFVLLSLEKNLAYRKNSINFLVGILAFLEVWFNSIKNYWMPSQNVRTCSLQQLELVQIIWLAGKYPLPPCHMPPNTAQCIKKYKVSKTDMSPRYITFKDRLKPLFLISKHNFMWQKFCRNYLT